MIYRTNACRTTRRALRGVATTSAMALALAACDDATGPDLTLPAGFLEFTYAGSVEGLLSVTGDLWLDDGRPVRQPFAAAGANQYANESKFTVVAFQPVGVTEGVYFAITVPDVPAGTTVPIDVNCFELSCSSTLLFFGVGPYRPHEDVDPDVDRACWINTGTLTVTDRTADRIEGTFSGTGSCVFDIRTDPLTPFAVVDGSFDVPISLAYEPRVDLR